MVNIYKILFYKYLFLILKGVNKMFHKNSKFFCKYQYKQRETTQRNQNLSNDTTTDWICPLCKFKVYVNVLYCNSCKVDRNGIKK